MNRIYKICLAIALFAVSASVAWAGFNYDSAHNYFLIDSILKSGGSYILVGDAFDEISDSFAVSNNLIFLNDSGQFTSGIRQMDKNNFATQQIQVKSPNTFKISASSGALKMGSVTGAMINIQMDNDFVLHNPQASGLALIDLVNPVANTIYANKVLTNSLNLYSGSNVLGVSPGAKLTVAAGASGTASATGITLANAPFCVKITWTPRNNWKDGASNPLIKQSPVGDKANDQICPSTGGSASIPGDFTEKNCCPTNYYIYDVNYAAGEMVCCRAAGQ